MNGFLNDSIKNEYQSNEPWFSVQISSEETVSKVVFKHCFLLTLCAILTTTNKSLVKNQGGSCKEFPASKLFWLPWLLNHVTYLPMSSSSCTSSLHDRPPRSLLSILVSKSSSTWWFSFNHFNIRAGKRLLFSLEVKFGACFC